VDVATIIKDIPQTVILGVIGMVCLVVLLVPLALRLAGLTGAQIADVLKLTMQFFINLVAEFRAQNRQPPA